jgi:flagellar export protein FliJ
MKRFAFRLERLLQLREASEKERARELGQARREEEMRRAAVVESEARLIEARAQFETTPRELSQAGTLQNLELAMESLSANVRQLSDTHEQSLERLEAERQQFEQARMARRVIERLREHRRLAWGEELSRHEQSVSDETALQRSQPRKGGDQ